MTSNNSFSKVDIYILLLLFLWAFFLNGVGLGNLEFFRHTEADRALIAWEMWEKGEWIVPHLLGAEIFTKPPFYYWILAICIGFFNSASEWTVRFPSLLFSAFFVACQYLVWRKLGSSKSLSIASALMLSTSVSFMLSARLGEMDMIFGFLFTMSYYSLFFSFIEASFLWTVLAYVFLALAILTKGIPTLFLFIALAFTFAVVRRQQVQCLYKAHVVGIFIFVLIMSAWLIPFVYQVGLKVLFNYFHSEVFQRILSDDAHKHGTFYYFWQLFVVSLPWSLLLMTTLIYFSRYANERSSLLKDFFKSNFFVFNLVTVIVIVLLLSLSLGKSARYLFPAQASIINLCLYSYLILAKKDFFCFSNKSLMKIFSFTILLMFFASIVFSEGYAPFRNQKRSVKLIAGEIHNQLPYEQELLTLELFERWVLYYLKHKGRVTKRLTPQLATELGKQIGTSYILLGKNDEDWRLEQIKGLDPNSLVVQEYPHHRDSYILVRVNNTVLAKLKPHDYFSTKPSKPY